MENEKKKRYMFFLVFFPVAGRTEKKMGKYIYIYIYIYIFFFVQKFAGLLPSCVTIQCQLYRDMVVLEGCRVAKQLYGNTPKCIARVCSGWKCITAWGRLESCIAIKKIVLQYRELYCKRMELYCKRWLAG